MNDVHVNYIVFTEDQERMLRRLSKDILRYRFAFGMMLGIIVVEILDAKTRLQALENRKKEMAG